MKLSLLKTFLEINNFSKNWNEVSNFKKKNVRMGMDHSPSNDDHPVMTSTPTQRNRKDMSEQKGWTHYLFMTTTQFSRPSSYDDHSIKKSRKILLEQGWTFVCNDHPSMIPPSYDDHPKQILQRPNSEIKHEDKKFCRDEGWGVWSLTFFAATTQLW